MLKRRFFSGKAGVAVTFIWIPMLAGLPLLGAALGLIRGWQSGAPSALRRLLLTALSTSAAFLSASLLLKRLSPVLFPLPEGAIFSSSSTLRVAAAELPSIILFPGIFLLLFILLRLLFARLLPKARYATPSLPARLLGAVGNGCTSFFCARILGALLAVNLLILSAHPTVEKCSVALFGDSTAAVESSLSKEALRRLFPVELSHLFSLHAESTTYPLLEETELVRLFFKVSESPGFLTLSEETLQAVDASPMGRQILWEIHSYLREHPETLFDQGTQPLAAAFLEEAQQFFKAGTPQTAAEDLILLFHIYELSAEHLPKEPSAAQTALLESDFLPQVFALLGANSRFAPLKTSVTEHLFTVLSDAASPLESFALKLLREALKQATNPETAKQLLVAAAHIAGLSINDSLLTCLSEYCCEAS